MSFPPNTSSFRPSICRAQNGSQTAAQMRVSLACKLRAATAVLPVHVKSRRAAFRSVLRVTSGGRQQFEDRQKALSLLGKDLAKRARSRCELCEGSGAKLFDTSPKAEPSLDTLLLLCERCTEMNTRTDGAYWRGLDDRSVRFLEESVWSEEPIIKSTSLMLLKKVGSEWSKSTVEMIADMDLD
ncbi:hypothetical protein CYMTET_22539 [Cymbomonas tetramitiformis]|uniref:Uncharacterized protein n=1 Tax=Cymbomonas tetramitiformis TaxID=36881 RepID=A0AAE0G078_9CHLO|nr:hypothetical protein CYMTET_22539 [Cymbomonas tetramitiformis]